MSKDKKRKSHLRLVTSEDSHKSSEAANPIAERVLIESDRSESTQQKELQSTPQVPSNAHATSAPNRDRYLSLVDIGIALSSEKELDNMLDLILDKALENTQADAATIYLIDRIKIDTIGNQGQKYRNILRFHRSANRNLGKRNQNLVLDPDTSIAGHVASRGESLVIDDCYEIPSTAPYKFNQEVDKKLGYRTKSMLTVPIMTSEKKVRGVIQVLNKLKSPIAGHVQSATSSSEDILPFAHEDDEFMRALASQACVAIENARLTDDIENLFESFIRASVTAIEQRDPTTSGHSDRVAVLTVELARATHRCTDGPYKNLFFDDQKIREIRYAALLHDFGKIGVKESILSKEQKLYPAELETILARLDAARSRQEMLAWKHLVEDIRDQQGSGMDLNLNRRIDNVRIKIDQFAVQMNQVKQSVVKANQPQIVSGDFDIARHMMWLSKASNELGVNLLLPEEVIKLSLPKGSLTEEERREIESHVSHTYKFLQQIAWTEDLSNVPDIAGAHHEKLDGSGYPRGLTAEHIPAQSKMMTIADIYDALTSMDRPYKPAASPERALEILYLEARDGHIDMDLFKIFFEAEIFRSAEGMARKKKLA